MNYASPNFDSRDGHAIDMLVLHYTGMKTAAEAIERLCDPQAKVSAHYVVELDGTVLPLVDESMRAWHAGVSYWRGATNINQRSIGIEIVNPGHEFGYTDFPAMQMQAVISLCQDILKRHPIPARNVVGHSDIAPTRKMDPGEKFDWAALAEEGVGLQASGFSGGEARSLEPEALATYGYEITDQKAAITAFQRHFRPKKIDGIWEAKCGFLLAGILELTYNPHSRRPDSCWR